MLNINVVPYRTIARASPFLLQNGLAKSGVVIERLQLIADRVFWFLSFLHRNGASYLLNCFSRLGVRKNILYTDLLWYVFITCILPFPVSFWVETLGLLKSRSDPKRLSQISYLFVSFTVPRKSLHDLTWRYNRPSTHCQIKRPWSLSPFITNQLEY